MVWTFGMYEISITINSKKCEQLKKKTSKYASEKVDMIHYT